MLVYSRAEPKSCWGSGYGCQSGRTTDVTTSSPQITRSSLPHYPRPAAREETSRPSLLCDLPAALLQGWQAAPNMNTHL